MAQPPSKYCGGLGGADAVLAIYRTTTLEQALKDYRPKNAQQRAAFDQSHAAKRTMLSKWQRDLLSGVSNARIVELPGVNLYMFLSNEADVIREVRSFAATLDEQVTGLGCSAGSRSQQRTRRQA